MVSETRETENAALAPVSANLVVEPSLPVAVGDYFVSGHSQALFLAELGSVCQ